MIDDLGEGRGCPHCRSKQLTNRVERAEGIVTVFLRCGACRREMLLWSGNEAQYRRRFSRRRGVRNRLASLARQQST